MNAAGPPGFVGTVGNSPPPDSRRALWSVLIGSLADRQRGGIDDNRKN